MNRYYRSYCRQVSEVMFLRPYFPRSVLDDAELVRERFQDEQALPGQTLDEDHEIRCGGMVQSY